MAPNRVRIRSSLHLGPQPAWRLLVVLALGLGRDGSLPSRCEAARIGPYLTARDLARPLLLSETGVPIQLRSPTHPDPVPPKGTVPTYLAFPVYGGEHLPDGTPTLTTAQRSGRIATVGPLNLDPLVRAQLDADLGISRMAIVETPHRHYAVEFVPRFARTHAQPAATAGTSPSNGNAGGSGAGSSAGPTTSPPTSASQPDPTIAGLPLSPLIHWTSIGVNDLSKTLGIGNPTPTPTKPGLNLQAQVLVPPLAQETSAAPLPVPSPEPSTWLVFGVILGAAGIRGAWRVKTGPKGGTSSRRGVRRTTRRTPAEPWTSRGAQDDSTDDIP